MDREVSLPLSPPPLSSDSALSFVRDMAVSRRVPLRRLAETNSLTAQILSFRRYTVDFNRSESVYEQVRESAKLMDRVEEPDWYLDPSNKMDCIGDMVSIFPETEDTDVDDSSDWSLRDPLPKDIHCCSIDKVVQSWDTRILVISSNSSVMKACGTMARISNHEEDAVKFDTDVQVEEHKSAVEELEDRNDHVEEENEKDLKMRKVTVKKGTRKMRYLRVKRRWRLIQGIEEENLNSSVRGDGEAENLQDTIDEEAGVETSDGECDDEEEEKAEKSMTDKKIDLRKMTLGEWFKFMEVHVQKQIVEETEKMFEEMRSKALRVDQYIAEQKQAKGKGSVS